MAPRKVWPQVPPEKLMQLRGNHSAEPGSPDKPRPKRTSVQVAKEKADKEEAKRTQAAAQHAIRQAVLQKEMVWQSGVISSTTNKRGLLVWQSGVISSTTNKRGL